MANHVNTDAPTASQNLPATVLNENIISADPTSCVICLETVSERAVALPCGHDCFDFPCLGNWLTKHRTCPLCKQEVKKLEYEFNGAGESKIFYLPDPEPDEVSHSGPAHPGDQRRYPQRRIRPPQSSRNSSSGREIQDGLGLERRRHIYRHRLLSLHVGTNRISRYQELKPQYFRNDELLLSRARMWIRRELQVFDFLNPDSADSGGERCRTNNAEFLLEYIIAILKTTDIKGSGGHAEDLLTDFLARERTRIFLHELQAWLRSPYQNLRDWDRAVQYDDWREDGRDGPASRIGDTRRPSSAPLSSPHSPRRWQSR
jgi:Ring finger domain